jgi:hypothetical protein
MAIGNVHNATKQQHTTCFKNAAGLCSHGIQYVQHQHNIRPTYKPHGIGTGSII